MQRIRNHLSFANVISMIALFVALGGTTYAAVSLPKNSVGAKQIKKRAVRGKHINKNAVSASKIQANAITGAKVADGSLGSLDILDNNLTAADLADNSVGAGETAPNSVGTAEVIDGSLGKADLVAGLLDHAITVQRTDVALADNTTQAAEASCPAGMNAIAGGASVDQTGSDDITQLVSRPGNGGFIPDDGQTFNDWRVVYRNPAGGTAAAEIRAFVVCMTIP
jgi:hypothetical protein